jgi:hypothetical protein
MAKYWAWHPQVGPFRIFVSPVEGIPTLPDYFVATAIFPEKVRAGTPSEGIVFKHKNVFAPSSDKALALAREWVEEQAGAGVRTKLIEGDDADLKLL